MAVELTPKPYPGREAIRDGSKATVLLVDDEAGIRALVREVLQKHGFEVLEAGNGVEALALADQCEGPIHLLLTDWHMPHVDGGVLSRGLRANHPETAVLFMSSHETPPGVAVLSKPFRLDDLVKKVQEAVSVRNIPVNGHR